MIIFTCLNVAVLYYKNRRKQQHRAQILAPYTFTNTFEANKDFKDSGDGLRSWVELGDNHPDFVYTYWMFRAMMQVVCICIHIIIGPLSWPQQSF